MKAAVTDGKGALWLADAPMPEPGDYQCLVKIEACATCTGTDQKHIANTLPFEQEYPGVLGHESVGRVIEIGPKVRHLELDDRVLRPTAVYVGERLGDYTSLWGGFAEYGLVTDRRALLEDNPTCEPNNYTRFQQTVPDALGLSAADATMLITAKETASYVASLGVRLTTSVLVLGSGSVAYNMCRFSKVFGADPVIVIGRRAAPLQHVAKVGADHTINSSECDVVEATSELTLGAGVDFIIDTTGDAAFVASCMDALKPDGKVADYATYKTPDAIGKALDPERVAHGATSEDLAHPWTLDAVRLGLVDLGMFYSTVMPFDRIAEGFEMLRNKAEFKIVFEMKGC